MILYQYINTVDKHTLQYNKIPLAPSGQMHRADTIILIVCIMV